MDKGRSRRRSNRRKGRRSSQAKVDMAIAQGEQLAEGLHSVPLDAEAGEKRDYEEDESRSGSDVEESGGEEEGASRRQAIEEMRKKKMQEDADKEDQRRSEGEGMLYDAATLEDEQTPRPGKFDTQAEKEAGVRMTAAHMEAKRTTTTTTTTQVSSDDADLIRSEGEGMLYDAASVSIEEEQMPRRGKFDTEAEKQAGARLGVHVRKTEERTTVTKKVETRRTDVGATTTAKEHDKKKLSAYDADLIRSEGEGMLYHAATLEEEQTPRPGKYGTDSEKRAGTRQGATKKGGNIMGQDDADLIRSEGEGMLYAASTLEEEQTPRRGKFDTEAEKRAGTRLGAPQKKEEDENEKEEEEGGYLSQDDADLIRSEGEGMLYAASTLEDEQTPRSGKFDTQIEKLAGLRMGATLASRLEEAQRQLRRDEKSESEAQKNENDKDVEDESPRPRRRQETEEEAYERLKLEAEEEQRLREQVEEEEQRMRQEEAEAEAVRLRMARDWEELERQRAAQEEEARKSREKVEEVLRAAEEEAQRRQQSMKETMKERELTEKLRREREIEELVMRQSLELQNRRDQLRQSSARRMGPVKWVPDEQVSACQSCQVPFTVLRRRHHCRACGKIFCAKCSNKEFRVRWYETPERVCATCYQDLQGNLAGKIVLMSGANSGVAARVAEEMARQGATLALLSPDAEESSALAQHIKKATGNTEVMPLWADFSSLESVGQAVERFRRQFNRIDVLINNCDVEAKNGREVHTLTHDGNEKLFSLKYLSHFLVVYSLLDLLKLSAPARVVNVCPHPGKHAHVNFDDLQQEHHWSPTRATEQSRLGIYCLTRELGMRLKGSGVAVNVLDLHHVYTSDQSMCRRAWSHLQGDTSDDEAMRAYLYMAASPLTQEVSRGCFEPDGTPTLFRGRALDEGFCAHFYRSSYDLVARWVAPDDAGGMMEGRLMEDALSDRIREAVREREDQRELVENERLEIDIGSDLDEEDEERQQQPEEEATDKRSRAGKQRTTSETTTTTTAATTMTTGDSGGGVGPLMTKKASEMPASDSRGRSKHVVHEPAKAQPRPKLEYDRENPQLALW